jgi:outer membrane protein, adhesin transport system
VRYSLPVVCIAASAVLCAAATYGFAQSGGFTVRDAILQAIQTNPGVGEAAANRRATESELRQNQSLLLPQVRLEASTGPEKLNLRDANPVPAGNDSFHSGSKASVVVRQLLFDGFASLNEIWRQAARTDAAAARVHERTELIALDTVEAYVDIVRYLRLVALAQENIQAHERIFGNMEARFRGGRAGEGDLEQARERVLSAKATLEEFRRSLEDARAKFRNVVGLEAYNLRNPSRLRNMPASRDVALATALRHNPTIQAAQSDADAARYGFRATGGSFSPTISLEGRATRGKDTDRFTGNYDEASGKVVMSWDIFNGGRDLWRRNEAAERYQEQSMRHARLQRAAFESIDKAWNARTITANRIVQLSREVEAARKTFDAYTKEFDIGQRSIIDLLNALNQLFNAQVSLVSSRAVVVFADYQLLAAMGALIEYVKAPHPVDAEPLPTKPFGIFPMKLAPVRLDLPSRGPEPLPVLPPDPPAGHGSIFTPSFPGWMVPERR